MPKKMGALIMGQHGISEPLEMKRTQTQETSQLSVLEPTRDREAACSLQLAVRHGVLAQAGNRA